MSTVKTLMILIFLSTLQTGFTQERWTITFRPDLNFLSTDLSNSNTKTGYGFEFTGSYRIIQHVDIYTGWGWNQFKGDNFLATENSTIKVSGASFGLRYIHPISNSKINFNIMGGIISDRIKTENPSGYKISDSDYDVGWQFGGGITYSFGGNWQLQPEIRYRSLTTEITNLSSSEEIKLNYLSFGIGLGVQF